MPLLDRIESLGLLDFDEPEDKTPKLLHSNDLRDSDLDESTDEEESDYESASSDSDSGSDMSEAQRQEDQAMRQVIGNSHGLLTLLGQAELRRHESRQPNAKGEKPYVGLQYPTGDDDAGDGFRLRGFHDGRRVYRLDTPLLKRLQVAVVKTAVGLCYLDVAAMCPPTVVSIPSSPVAPSDDAGSPSPPPPPVLEVNGCFAIRASPLGGLGAFALRDLQRGEHLLVERPLLRTDLFHLSRELDRLSPEKRAAFFALTGHHPDPRASAAERVWTANTFVAGALEGVFERASRFNHACKPNNNVDYRYDRRHNVLVMTAVRRITAGAELLITYGKSPRMLFQRFGFRCTCGACTGFTEEMAKQYYDKSWS